MPRNDPNNLLWYDGDTQRMLVSGPRDEAIDHLRKLGYKLLDSHAPAMDDSVPFVRNHAVFGGRRHGEPRMRRLLDNVGETGA